MNEPYMECTRYQRCSVNHCPLDPDQDTRQSHPGDKQQKCTLAKTIRVRIGSKYPDSLTLGGLTPREHQSKLRWSKLTAAQKQAITDKGRANIERINLKQRTKTQNL